MSTIITTGSGVVIYDSAKDISLSKCLHLINQMISENFVDFKPSNGDLQEIQTYSKNNDVVKYIDLMSQGALFFTISYPMLAKASEVSKFASYLALLKDLFVNLVLDGDDSIENIKSFDVFEVKEKLKNIQFAAYAEELFKKVENNDVHVVDSDEESDEDDEERQVDTKKEHNSVEKNTKKSKKSRKWTQDGEIIEVDDVSLDFTEEDAASAAVDADVSNLAGDTFGHMTKDGYVIENLSSEIDSLLSKKKTKANNGSSFDFLRKYLPIGGVISNEALEKSCKSIENSLIKKNVSSEVAQKLVSSLKPRLTGKRIAGFQSVENEIKAALSAELTSILTPNTSIDLLNEIAVKKTKSADPYVISVVGVNGVGKSTNLSKLAFWLLNNKYNVLIAACDTFRSGAVEQLKVHERNLNKLIKNSSNSTSKLQVFEQGYGNVSKVSLIAKNSIKYAKENGFDIVLMDTAGRSHSDSKLMAPLKDFALAAKPDKIIMVAEALVGTDSVMQAYNFNKSFDGTGRKVDFFIISKCDTVGDLIGTMVNMVYTTGIPILFVGVGQMYTDLRGLSVNWAVDTLVG